MTGEIPNIQNEPNKALPNSERYINPYNRASSEGRRLTGDTYEKLFSQLGGNEVLVAECDRGVFKQAVHLYSKEEFSAFYDQYESGIILSFTPFACEKTILLRK